MAGVLPPMYVPSEPKWKHWPTYIYDMNYNYGINFYQPMIDYIDRKGRTSTALDYRYMRLIEPPELPWSDGRALWESRPVEPYTTRELVQHAIDAEDQAREHLSRFKIANRSDFSLSKTAQASHVTREVLPRRLEGYTRLHSFPLFVESARVRSQARQIQRDMASINLQALKEVQALSESQRTLDRNKSLRGKSARAIEFQLTADALRNLATSQQLADIRKYQMERSMWDGRETHLKLLEQRTKDLLENRTRDLLDEERLTAPLNSLSRELRGYEQKSSNYFLDQRYRDPTRPRRLYGCLG
ncbi:paramyosin, short form-like [Hylaeus anthracinus]|uniref:paramyosin, short form-like n=1 Tax=Hylaeus anthracinus TaxID=313031 RepID=UPI0023BA3D2A|nr:paramyosin, short form-like [Hylaeus anthracinus]